MTAWHAWVTALTIAIVSAVATVACALAGIWLESDQLGATAGVLGILAFCTGGASLGGGPRGRPLPRAQRRALKQAQADIDLQAAIKRAEKEAGL